MATLSEIQSPVWSLGIQGFGYVVQGIEAVKQRLNIAITTSKGSDPLRPEFGTNIYRYIDNPNLKAAANIQYEILEVVKAYVPEVTIVSIKRKVGVGTIDFEILFKTDDGISDVISYTIGSGTIRNTSKQQVILQGIFPANPNAYNYTVRLVLNDTVINPQPPAGGFASVEALVLWMQTNWAFAGRWLVLPDQIVLYGNGDTKTGSITISLLQQRKVLAAVKELGPGQRYSLLLTPQPGQNTVLADPEFFTAQQLLDWVSENWQQYGSWSLQTYAGDFNADFGDDFFIGGTMLQLLTETHPLATLTVNRIG